MTGRLQNKNAIVTGGARGIGEGIVDLFVREGARIILADIDPNAKAFEDRFGRDAVRFKHTDVTREDDIAAAVDFCVETFGSLDVMVNNAGALGDQSAILELDAEGFDRTTRLLLRSAALGHKYAGRQMKKQGGGSIVTTSSIAAIEAGWSAASYDAAKAGILQLARSATYELAPFGIRSNVVAPGLILTPIIATACDIAPEDYDAFTAAIAGPYSEIIPLRQPGLPEDIAEAVLFFASDAARHITGQTLAVDGGLTSITAFDIGAVVASALEAFNAGKGREETASSFLRTNKS
ncbi:MAG: SDR family NAD(P)-dependent oxidoreductase [Sphingobium sp.]